ncbi:hypothetical protein GDO78_005994 [Eleutherodactylus coqui]|uniref:Uncharacterized protein n=1 Tax=Eleutherodactylus coqui TaxID=57060 RepID=A0A8J6FMR3_ELECQ|nr:hypothetical protein GDO78_005994 [Eleutherodactylus coqui]
MPYLLRIFATDFTPCSAKQPLSSHQIFCMLAFLLFPSHLHDTTAHRLLVLPFTSHPMNMCIDNNAGCVMKQMQSVGRLFYETSEVPIRLCAIIA